MGRVLTVEELCRERADVRGRGQRFVLTNGHFDLLHVGHVRYLQQARALGDVLAVAVNSDASTTARKGPRRPIVPEAERAELLAALACVDYVIIFDTATAEGIVTALMPDIYAKGGDYAGPDASPLPEAALVEAAGGTVALLPLVADHSTTDLVERVLHRYGSVRAGDTAN